jgi:hypothetical protein
LVTESSSAAHSVRTANSNLTLANRWDHFLARWAVNRSGHRVEPALYALGSPAADSPVFVTANYTLSFDALRVALSGIDVYILVLDTRGINVWCAAGKGTFGTGELVRQIGATNLDGIVDHRVLILPQLGAAGVAAHEVKKRTGFKVEYGPVRAEDLPQYLKAGRATTEMRRVSFNLRERLVLIPVELVHSLLPTFFAALALFVLAGRLAALGALVSVLAGVVIFPILLPWLPTADFSSKGFILGAAVALPLSLAALNTAMDPATVMRAGWAVAYLLAMPPVTAYLALNFTGSTPITSKSGVKREMNMYVPVMARLSAMGALAIVVLLSVSRLGVP